MYIYTHASFVKDMQKSAYSWDPCAFEMATVLLFFHVTFVSLNTRTCVCVCKGHPLLIRNVCASVPWLTFVLTLDIQPAMPFC